MYKENLAPRLKAAREMTCFTQEQVSELTGIPQGNISRYEKATREPDAETLGILANFYGVSIDWLFGLGMQPGNKPNYDTVGNKKAL